MRCGGQEVGRTRADEVFGGRLYNIELKTMQYFYFNITPIKKSLAK
ncbi:MAG: hypothetical protein LBB09_03295 [Rickettsiales bacterium]|jgi:hypothetical protein|nr:hypothetical protein [Rickettsiales bacterium]